MLTRNFISRRQPKILKVPDTLRSTIEITIHSGSLLQYQHECEYTNQGSTINGVHGRPSISDHPWSTIFWLVQNLSDNSSHNCFYHCFARVGAWKIMMQQSTSPHYLFYHLWLGYLENSRCSNRSCIARYFWPNGFCDRLLTSRLTSSTTVQARHIRTRWAIHWAKWSETQRRQRRQVKKKNVKKNFLVQSIWVVVS